MHVNSNKLICLNKKPAFFKILFSCLLFLMHHFISYNMVGKLDCTALLPDRCIYMYVVVFRDETVTRLGQIKVVDAQRTIRIV